MSSSALMTRSGGPALANGGSADLSSSSSTSSMEFERESGAKFEWVGAPAGTHGSYTFYKAFKFTSADCRPRVLGLGDFFLVKMWTHQDIVSIAELQLVWEDRFQPAADHHPHRSTAMVAQQPPPLASLKLYFLPENTPDGRLDEHGQDEVICISEKVVLKVTDLLTWIVDDVKWERGACASTDGCGVGAGGAAKWPTTAAPLLDSVLPDGGEFHGGFLDMRDVIKEKQLTGEDGWSQTNEVMVLSYPAYCRYRAALKRLENCDEQYTRHAVMMAIGGASPPGPNTRVVFCKDTFEYPELEDHELLCNHLAPKWKGRRGRKGRKKRSNSPGSESNESESSGSTVTSSRASKDSPLKNGFRRSPMPFNSGRVSADRPKGEQIFLQKLHKFMAGRGTPIGRLPSLGFKQLDLFLFYHKVQRAGGYEAAVANKLWKGIYIELGGHPSNTSAATCTRRHYEKLLLPYERYAAANGSADDYLEAASAGNGGSSASASGHAGAVLSPPKKRKLSDPTSDLHEALQLKAESDGLQSNLTLKELMLGESMGALADSKHSALSDLARIATKHKGSLKDVKLHPHSADSIQITVVNKNEPVSNRPSVIQKSASSSSSGASVPSSDKTRTDPQPAHNQKPITPLNPSAELCQYYAQLLAADSSKSPTSLMNDPVGLSLTLGMNLRPPIPAAATPSIFVPTHRIFTDPNLDIKKNRAASTSGTNTTNSGTPATSSGSIPAAHSKTAVVQGKPPAGPAVNQQTTPATPAAPPVATPPTRNVAPHHPQPHHSSPAALVRPANTPPPLVSAPPPLQPVAAPHSSHHRSAVHLPVKVESSIPLVDLTSRHSSAPSMQPVVTSRNADPPTPVVKTEVNGKCLLDLSNKQLQQQLLKSPPSGPVKHAPWSSSPKGSGDVSISVNVKVEGQESKRSVTESTVTPAAASTNRHSVTVMPVIKDERHRSKTSDKDRVSVTPMHHSSGYPRMVESLVGHSPGGSGMQNSSKNSSAPSPYYGSGSGPSKGSSSTSSSAAKSAPAPAESPMMYPHLLDPALASYYSSLYSPHNLYNSLAAAAAASNPFLAQAPSSMPGFPPHMTSASASAAAAEVTAQVYKDLVQRGYPPALAPGLPPHLGALAANIPGLGSLASYTSMYSSLGGKDGPGNGERSIPKS